jgi:cytidylate kinase
MHHFMDKLVNKAVERSQLHRVSKLQIKSDWTPDIVISRDPGSGGQVVAKKLAKKLGWQLFDKSLMKKLSEDLGIPEGEVVNVDEHSRSWMSDLFHSVFNPHYVSDVRYITHLKKLLNHAAKSSDLVIIGHGAGYILPPDKCLRVRVTAPFDTRVDNTYKYESFKTKSEARMWVEKVEKQYNQFIRQYFGKNPHNPWHYDLVVSTHHFSLDQVTDLIIKAYLTKFPGEKKRLKIKNS